jgi:hypothetical protein
MKGIMRAYKTLWVLLVQVAGVSLCAQGTITLIGPSIRNGSFEDGILSPWTVSGDNAGVVQDSGFAAEGEWFAFVSDRARGSIVRPSLFQRPPAASANGTAFSLSFAARNGVAAFEGIRVFFAALNIDQTVVFTTNAFYMLPPSGWGNYQAEYLVPSAWGGGLVSLGFQFESYNAVAGTSYRGYLDNIVLQQIPEPSSLVLYLCGGALWLGARVWRRTGCALKRPVLKTG